MRGECTGVGWVTGNIELGLKHKSTSKRAHFRTNSVAKKNNRLKRKDGLDIDGGEKLHSAYEVTHERNAEC